VTNLHVRDSLLIDMIADEQTRRGTDSTCTDQNGKVFLVGQDVRKCLVCDGVFTAKQAAEHANVSCFPSDIQPFRHD
jgi:hypothetical protein